MKTNQNPQQNRKTHSETVKSTRELNLTLTKTICPYRSLLKPPRQQWREEEPSVGGGNKEATTMEGRKAWCGWPEQGNVDIGGKKNEEAVRER